MHVPCVLVVHSDFALRLAWRDTFERLGWHVGLAAEQNGALQALRAQEISVLCVGGEPEEKSPATVMSRLAAAHPEVVRVLLLSQAGGPPSVTELNQAAAHGFLEEPPSVKGITAIIDSALEAAWPSWLRRQLWKDRVGERAHPGLARVPRSDGGDYLVDQLRAARAIDRLRLERAPLRDTPPPDDVGTE